jgi:hypothetical protein
MSAGAACEVDTVAQPSQWSDESAPSHRAADRSANRDVPQPFRPSPDTWQRDYAFGRITRSGWWHIRAAIRKRWYARLRVGETHNVGNHCRCLLVGELRMRGHRHLAPHTRSSLSDLPNETRDRRAVSVILPRNVDVRRADGFSVELMTREAVASFDQPSPCRMCAFTRAKRSRCSAIRTMGDDKGMAPRQFVLQPLPWTEEVWDHSGERDSDQNT